VNELIARFCQGPIKVLITEERIGRVKGIGQFPSLIITFPVFFLHQGKLFAETGSPRLRPPPINVLKFYHIFDFQSFSRASEILPLRIPQLNIQMRRCRDGRAWAGLGITLGSRSRIRRETEDL
jgi:hypothetical protein